VIPDDPDEPTNVFLDDDDCADLLTVANDGGSPGSRPFSSTRDGVRETNRRQTEGSSDEDRDGE
jgi:hypothetical protein